MTEDNSFRDIESIKEFTKNTIFQCLDNKNEKVPIYPEFFKDFPNNKKLNFGMILGMALTFVQMEGMRQGVSPDMLGPGIRESMEDIHDELKSRYENLNN